MLRPLNPLAIPVARRPRRAAAAAICLVVLGGLTACTGETSGPSPSPSPDVSTGTAETLDAKPVPLTVRVTRVAGELNKSARASLEHTVGRAISTYFDAALLGGDYPRATFGGAFASFSHGAARKADADRDLLTNRALGVTTESVTPKKKEAYLSVLAPNKIAAGVTARIRLAFVANRGDKEDQLVTLTGRLLLTRKDGGGWQIFGYDVARSSVAVGKGASR